MLDAGIDTIIHGDFREPDGSETFRPEIADRIAEQGVFVNKTIGGSIAGMRILEAEDNLSEAQQEQLDETRRSSEMRLGHFARLREAGVMMAAGSDSAWGLYKMGDFQTEIEAHVMGGMSNMEAIVAATRDSARSCWTDSSVGTLEPGKEADVLVVDGDPLEDINQLRRVSDVFLAGNRVDRENFI